MTGNELPIPLPSGWASIPIRAVARRREETDRADLPLLSVYRDVGVVPREGREDNYNKPGMNLSDYKVVYPGDLVMNKMKTWQGSLAVSEHHGIVSPAYFVCELNDRVDRRFLHYQLRSRPYVERYAALSKGIRPQQWDLPWDAFKSIRLAVPEPREQCAIANFLDRETTRIDELLTRKEALQTVLRQRMERLIAGEGRLADVEFARNGLPLPPDEYPVVQLGRVARVQSGITLDAGRLGTADDVQRPYLRVANVQAGRVDLEEVKEVTVPRRMADAARLQPGDVLMTEGGDPDKLGRGTVWQGEIANCIHQNHVFAIRAQRERLLPDYLAYLTRTPYARAYFEVTASKTTGIASTSSRRIAAWPVPVPPSRVQACVVESIRHAEEQISELVRILSRQLRLLTEHRQALITAAVAAQMPGSRSQRSRGG